jgi:hypothetical protein
MVATVRYIGITGLELQYRRQEKTPLLSRKQAASIWQRDGQFRSTDKIFCGVTSSDHGPLWP